MRRIIIIALLALGSVVLLGGCIHDPMDNVDNTYFSAKEDFSFETNIQHQDVFTLSAINGSVDLVGISGATSVRVWGEKEVQSESYSDARQNLQNLDVSMSHDDNAFMVRTVQPQSTQGRTYTVRYQVRIPAEWTVSLSQTNGDVHVDVLQNTLTITVVNGTVRIRNLEGSAIVGVTNGTIDTKMRLPVDGACTMGMVNGNVTLAVPKTTSAKFSASVVNGKIYLNDLDLSNRSSGRTQISGQLGEGRGKISLSAVNGNVTAEGY